MSTDRRMKDKSMAAYLRDRKVIRITGKCPWGCGREVRNGGEPLLIHLKACPGKRSKLKKEKK